MRCRRKTDAETRNDEHAEQEQPSQPSGKRRRVSGPGPQIEQSDPMPGRTNRGRAAKTASTEQPHRTRKPGWGKWQQYSDMYVAKPKPKSISTWRQLTMQQGKPEEDHKQATNSDDTEGSQSDDGESLDLQPHPVQEKQSLASDRQQRAYPRNGAQKHKTSVPEHAGTVITSLWQAILLQYLLCLEYGLLLDSISAMICRYRDLFASLNYQPFS